MRGTAVWQATMLTAVTPDALVPEGHPIRKIKPLVDRALTELSPVFDQMYAEEGRPSIPPEHLLKGCLLIALFSVRSERQFCERLHYDLLFKWFLDLNILDPAPSASLRTCFDHYVFSKNKDRLLEHQVAREFFKAIVEEARRRHLLSEEHFTVDGTLLEAWASMKSFRPKEGGENPPSDGGRNPAVDFRGEQRANDTHASRTDPEARLARKGPGREAKLCFTGHVLMENRHGLVVDVQITQASGTAELIRPWTCCRLCRVVSISRWERIKDTTPRTLCGSAGTWRLRPMWPRSSTRPSMGGPPGIPDTG